LEIQESAISSNQITEIVIPSSVTKIGQNTFYLPKLTHIEIEGGNNEYFSTDGTNLVDVKNKILLLGRESSDIPTDGSVEVIGKDAFYYCKEITEFYIPNTITTINNYAFAGSSLTSIEIPSSVTFIGYNAFNCDSLTNVTLSSITGWQVKINGTWQDIPSNYDLTDSSVVAELLTKTYVGCYWQNISE